MSYYRSLRNYVMGAIDREKKAYFTFYVNNNKSKTKQMWDHLKRTCSLGHNVQIQATVPPHLSDPNKINDFLLDAPGKASADIQTVIFFKDNRLSDREFHIHTITGRGVKNNF